MPSEKEAIKFHDELRKVSTGCNNRRLSFPPLLGEQPVSMAKKKDKQVEKLDRLVEVMTNLISEEFTGHLKINFTQGGIGRVEKFEEILKLTSSR